jgi:eukaryotic-like serine/threonine-protein kinase
MATCPECRTQYDKSVIVCEKDGARLLDDSAVPAAEQPISPGDTIGEYRVESKIGEGGFGAVYRAVHPVIGKTVAIKVLSRRYSSDAEIVSRFVSEARAVNQIGHKNIIDIFAFGVLGDGRRYYVMELLDGVTLDRHLERLGRLSPGEAIPILHGIARALDAAHAAGIAHRDLKPENVFLAYDEDRGFEPKLLDFGIAKLFADPSREHQTRTGVPLGTPYYMSPEQCRGQHVDQRTDVYSFGVLTYKLLTGVLPFMSEAFMDVMMMHVSDEPPPMSKRAPGLEALDAAVAHMLAKDPAKRPATLGAALEELARAARGAGHEVQVPANRSGKMRSGDAVLSSEPTLPKGMTPSQFAEIASADTLARATTASIGTPALPGGRRSPRVALYLGGGAVIVALAVWVATRPRHEPPPAASVVAAPQPPVSEAPPAPTPTKVAAPAPPPVPREIELTVESVPKNVDVYLGEEKLGAAPGPLHLERGTRSVELVLKASGYVSRTIRFTPSANGVVSATLQKVARAPRPGSTKKSELEF